MIAAKPKLIVTEERRQSASRLPPGSSAKATAIATGRASKVSRASA